MSKNKQTYNPCDDCRYSYTKNGQESGMCEICEFTYFKDHRQSEGEWVKVLNHIECSRCGYHAPYKKIKAGYHLRDLTKFCPNCGAKMKGGAE